jgi:hypothetical protein
MSYFISTLVVPIKFNYRGQVHSFVDGQDLLEFFVNKKSDMEKLGIIKHNRAE